MPQYVAEHPAAVWLVGPFFAAVTGLAFKEVSLSPHHTSSASSCVTVVPAVTPYDECVCGSDAPSGIPCTVSVPTTVSRMFESQDVISVVMFREHVMANQRQWHSSL